MRPRRRQLPQGPSVCDKIAASSDCSRPVNDYVHIEAADLRRPNARFTTERQGYQVLTPFGKLGYSQIAEIVANVALNLFSNYFNHVAGTVVDFPEVRPVASRRFGPGEQLDPVGARGDSLAVKQCS